MNDLYKVETEKTNGCQKCKIESKFLVYTHEINSLVCVKCVSKFKKLNITKIQLVKLIADYVEHERKLLDLDRDATISLFISLLKENRFSRSSWNNIDVRIYKTNGTDKWFWLIRTLRNYPDYWKIKR